MRNVKKIKVVILAAGKGTRMRPLSLKTPKPLLKIKHQPILSYVLQELPLQKINEIIIIIGYLGQKIKKYFGATYKNVPISYIKQKKYNGTLGALLTARQKLKASFLVLNGDDIYQKNDLIKLISYPLAMGVQKIKKAPPRYLALDISRGYIKGAHKPLPEEFKKGIFIATGAYMLDQKNFQYKPVKTKKGELGLPHTIFKAIPKLSVKAVNFKKWRAINCPEDLNNYSSS